MRPRPLTLKFRKKFPDRYYQKTLASTSAVIDVPDFDYIPKLEFVPSEAPHPVLIARSGEQNVKAGDELMFVNGKIARIFTQQQFHEYIRWCRPLKFVFERNPFDDYPVSFWGVESLIVFE